ncbi:MAG: RNA polymerase-binding protein DksA [Deltaproteobacteria bacterium]|nr:RNA polymerase-binding protein DksA [Deltaproteobacteria bacterium]
MEKERLDFFRELLQKKLSDLLNEAGKTVDEMNVLAKDNFPDPVDRASMESDRSFDLRIRDRERRLIAKVNEAIERIEDGTFGICEVCGEEIGEKRLEARPVTTLCIECKQEQEEAEKKHH